MRLTQRTALPLFVERGFDEVPVTEIAAEVGMAPSTLYRHFATKEDIVIWDENDVEIGKALTAALKRNAPMAAIREVFVTELGGRYDVDLDFQLARVQYIYRTEQLHAAAVEADFRARQELTDGLKHFMTKKSRDKATIIAGAALLVLDVAIDRWQQDNAATPLGELIDEGFDDLEHLSAIR